MKREIKFRAWNAAAKTMYQNVMVHGNNIVIAKYNIETDSEDPLIEPMTYSINSKFNWELMQFTGLLDKNGKEIYEGDIIKCGLYSYSIGDVQFSHGVFGIEWVHAKESKSMLGGWGQLHNLRTMDDNHMNEPNYMEVIGNIYENPELIA